VQRVTMAVDIDGDGVPDMLVTGVDLDGDGIVDILQEPSVARTAQPRAVMRLTNLLDMVLEALGIEAALPDGMPRRNKCHANCCVFKQATAVRESDPEDPRRLHERVVICTSIPPQNKPHRLDRCMVCVDDTKSMITLPQVLLQRCNSGVTGVTASIWKPNSNLAQEASEGIPTPDDAHWHRLKKSVPTEFVNAEHVVQNLSVKVSLTGPQYFQNRAATESYLVLGFSVDKFWWSSAKPDEKPVSQQEVDNSWFERKSKNKTKRTGSDLNEPQHIPTDESGAADGSPPMLQETFFVSLKLDLTQPIIGYLNDPSIFCPLEGGLEMVNSVLLGFFFDRTTNIISVNHVSFASGMIDLPTHLQ